MAKERESRERGKLADTERNSRERRRRRRKRRRREKEEAKEVVGEKERERTVKFEM